MKLFKFIVATSFLFAGYQSAKTDNHAPYPWEEHGKLIVDESSRIIQHEDGTPFLWLGCTALGMTDGFRARRSVCILMTASQKG